MIKDEKCTYHKMKLPCVICLEDRRREKNYIKEQKRQAEEYHRKARQIAAKDDFFTDLGSYSLFSNIFD